MKILLSWSSGKDSAWALHLLNLKRPGAVAALLTTVNESVDRVAMHGVRREVLEAQARAAGLPLRVVPIPHPCPNEVYEARMRAAVARCRARRLHACGVRRSVPRGHPPVPRGAAGRLGAEPMFPVWGIPTDALARTDDRSAACGRGSRASTRGCSTRAFAGREFDRDAAARSSRDRSIRAARTASSTRVSTRGRCSRSRSRSKSARRTRSRRMSGAI